MQPSSYFCLLRTSADVHELWKIEPYILFFTALEKLREEFKADSESLAHSEAISILSYDWKLWLMYSMIDLIIVFFICLSDCWVVDFLIV